MRLAEPVRQAHSFRSYWGVYTGLQVSTDTRLPRRCSLVSSSQLGPFDPLTGEKIAIEQREVSEWLSCESEVGVGRVEVT